MVSQDLCGNGKPPERELTEPEQKDIFQDLFNTIANDLATFRSTLSPEEVMEIRQVAELRYAAAMAPDAFSGYLGQDPSGEVFIVRLPARDDPMVDRVRKLRVRDDMLVDAINGFYDGYYQDLWEPYNDWRKFRGEEVSAMRELERQALTRQILGVAAIVGAIALGASSDSDTRAQTSTLRDVMVMGGRQPCIQAIRRVRKQRSTERPLKNWVFPFRQRRSLLLLKWKVRPSA